MAEIIITNTHLSEFRNYLIREERSSGTIEKYLRDVTTLQRFLSGQRLTKDGVTAWKDSLIQSGRAVTTINSMVVAANRFLGFIGMEQCRVRTLKVQRRLFRENTRELTRTDYEHLVDTACRHGKYRLALLMETICATGIRVSEVQYITVEAAHRGRTEVMLKGKIRTILLPNKLCRKLLKYAQKQKNASGEIFITKSGKGLSRKQIWAEMKSIAQQAKVAGTKVFPHNLRHLFARAFYKVSRDIVRLADVLGHSNVETTRIYLISTGKEYARQLEQLRLIR